jgi:hypothetical protein
VVLVAGLALAGCGATPLAGSAAVVGEERLADSELADAAAALSEALGIPENVQISQTILSRWIIGELIEELAERKDISVTQGAVDRALRREQRNAGGPEALEQGALQAGVLPDAIPAALRVNLLVQEISKYTITGDDPTGQSGLLVQVQQLSEELEPQVSPRFGTWDPQSLTVGSLPDDLSTPADTTELLTGLPPATP